MATINLKLLFDRDYPEIFKMMQKAKVTGLPEKYDTSVVEFFAKSRILGSHDIDGNLAEVFIAGKTIDGAVYLQGVARGKLSPGQVMAACDHLMREDPTCGVVWTQVTRIDMPTFLNAYFIPASALNVSQPILTLPRAYWARK